MNLMPSPQVISAGHLWEAACRVTNTIVGALVIMSLTNGMNLGVDISFQYVVKGAIFILAVAFDVTTRKRGKPRSK